jgi:trimeric autotransporter adhesin
MKKQTKLFLILAITFLLFLNSVKAQVGIGVSDPAPSAMLDITSSNKGLLIPRIALASITDVATIPSPANGLLIWNNGLGAVSAAGFYFWNNSKWNQVATTSTAPPSSGSWSTSGNNVGNYGGASTNVSLGTSAYDDLVFKVNSINVGRLGVNNSVSFGKSSNAGQDGVSIGSYSGAAQNAAAIGDSATANGYKSLAIGFRAETTSNGETAVGFQAKTSGQNSTALGSGAKAQAQFSTAIGYNALTSQSNAIVLGNSNANVGIGTSTPNTTAKLDVNGQYKLGINGSVQKSQISFEVWPSVTITNLPSGKTTTMNIAVPAGFTPSATRATIIVTPASDFAGNSTFSISNPRLTSTTNITINLTNISGNAESLNSAHFYVTINEF